MDLSIYKSFNIQIYVWSCLEFDVINIFCCWNHGKTVEFLGTEYVAAIANSSDYYF